MLLFLSGSATHGFNLAEGLQTHTRPLEMLELIVPAVRLSYG